MSLSHLCLLELLQIYDLLNDLLLDQGPDLSQYFIQPFLLYENVPLVWTQIYINFIWFNLEVQEKQIFGVRIVLLVISIKHFGDFFYWIYWSSVDKGELKVL
jgi:hypothetical protein